MGPPECVYQCRFRWFLVGGVVGFRRTSVQLSFANRASGWRIAGVCERFMNYTCVEAPETGGGQDMVGKTRR